MTTIQSIIDTSINLQHQNATYVAIAVRERKIHKLSTSVSNVFSIASNMQQMTTDDIDSELIRDHIRQLDYHPEREKSGFYSGLSIVNIGLLHMINEQNDDDEKRLVAGMDLFTPYRRYSLPTAVLQGIIGQQPVITNHAHGPFTLTPSGHSLGDIGISINIPNPNPYIICKIDQCTNIEEIELPNGDVFPEMVISSHWTNTQARQIHNRALDLVSALVNNDETGGEWNSEPMNQALKDEIREAINGNWEVIDQGLVEITYFSWLNA